MAWAPWGVICWFTCVSTTSSPTAPAPRRLGAVAGPAGAGDVLGARGGDLLVHLRVNDVQPDRLGLGREGLGLADEDLGERRPGHRDGPPVAAGVPEPPRP